MTVNDRTLSLHPFSLIKQRETMFLTIHCCLKNHYTIFLSKTILVLNQWGRKTIKTRHQSAAEENITNLTFPSMRKTFNTCPFPYYRKERGRIYDYLQRHLACTTGTIRNDVKNCYYACPVVVDFRAGSAIYY